MKRTDGELSHPLLTLARHSLRRHHLPRIARCLNLLSEKEIWWRPHRTSNSIGNLVLHLEGNLRQWVIAGLGAGLDRRDRDREFSERGPIPKRELLSRLRRTVSGASRVLQTLSARDLKRRYSIQGFRVTGLKALCHAIEHFAHHSGQIIYATKLKVRYDVGFTRWRGVRRKRPRESILPAI